MAWMAVENQGGFASGVLLVAVLFFFAPLLARKVFRVMTKTHEKTSEPPVTGSRYSTIPKEYPLNTRYFGAAQVGACLTLPFCLVIPLSSQEAMKSGYSVFLLLFLCLVSGVALVYSNRKRDLRWLDQASSESNEVDEP